MRFIVSDLYVSFETKPIVKGTSFAVKSEEIHALMGPNGSGKSTLALAIMGHPAYKVTDGEVLLDKKNILKLSPCERARAGLFLAFQKPVSIPGVSVINFLRTAFVAHCIPSKENCKTCSVREFLSFLREKAKLFNVNDDFLKRDVNEGFSGGEMKKLEMLTMAILSPRFAILDEIDAGLDIDALKIVASGIKILSKQNIGILVITHYQRVLRYLKPDFVHVMINGKIVASGNSILAKELEKTGYGPYQ